MSISKGFTTPVGRKVILKPVGRVRGWADEEVGFVKQPTIAVNTKGEAKVLVKPRGGEGTALGGSFEQAPNVKGKYGAWSVKTSPKDKPSTTVTKRNNPFGIESIFKMAWDEKTTPKYWKLKAMADRGKTPEERAAFKAKLDEHVKAHKEPGKDAPDFRTNPEYKEPPPPPPNGSNPPPRGGQKGWQEAPNRGAYDSPYEQAYRRADKEWQDRTHRANEWARQGQEKINNQERKMWGGKTKAERTADFANARRATFKSAKGPFRTARAAWNTMPSGSKAGAGMYAATGAAMAGGAAYVHHTDPNRKPKVKVAKAQAKDKVYSRGEKAGAVGSLGALLGGATAAQVASELGVFHAGEAQNDIRLANTYNAAEPGGASAAHHLDRALKHTKAANRAKAVTHGGIALAAGGVGGALLTERHYQNRMKAKAAQKAAARKMKTTAVPKVVVKKPVTQKPSGAGR